MRVQSSCCFARDLVRFDTHDTWRVLLQSENMFELGGIRKKLIQSEENIVSVGLDMLLQKVTVLEQANIKQSKKNKDLEESNAKLKAEVTNLSDKLKVCKESLNNLEQYTRRECLEVSGIPELQDENNQVIKVGSLMGAVINKEDISVSHRIPKPSFNSVTAGNRNNVEASSTLTTPKIIVKFVRRDTRDRFYQSGPQPELDIKFPVISLANRLNQNTGVTAKGLSPR